MVAAQLHNLKRVKDDVTCISENLFTVASASLCLSLICIIQLLQLMQIPCLWVTLSLTGPLGANQSNL